MTASFSPLQRYWQMWEPKLKTILRSSSNARLEFPHKLKLDPTPDAGGFAVVRPASPICIYDAPQKASSKKRGDSHRLIIVMNGSFKLIAEPKHPCLMGATCSITFLNKEHESDDALRVKLVDALHFDVDSKPFHPIFHAQRGIGTSVEECRQLLGKFWHGDSNKIEIDLTSENHVLSNPYLRLPTPQLDLFAVFTMVAADYFCNGGEIANDSGVIDRFRSILNLLADEKNIVREGRAAKCLNDRFTAAKNICAAHWYPEVAN